MAALNEDDAKDIKEQKNRNDRLKRDQIAIQGAIRSLFASSDGRLFLRWLLGVSRAFGEQPFTGVPSTTDFACGEIEVGRRITAQLVETDPHQFCDLIKENYDAARRTHQPDGNTGNEDEGPPRPLAPRPTRPPRPNQRRRVHLTPDRSWMGRRRPNLRARPRKVRPRKPKRATLPSLSPSSP